MAGTMQRIREIAVQTAASSRQTAQDVGKLTQLSSTLRESVAGFTIPETSNAEESDADPRQD